MLMSSKVAISVFDLIKSIVYFKAVKYGLRLVNKWPLILPKYLAVNSIVIKIELKRRTRSL